MERHLKLVRPGRARRPRWDLAAGISKPIALGVVDGRVVLDRRALQRAVAPADLASTLAALRESGVVRSYRLTKQHVHLDADRVALELALGHIDETTT